MDRWLDPDRVKKINMSHFIPFSGGGRNCIGQRKIYLLYIINCKFIFLNLDMATIEATIRLIYFVKNFEINLKPGYELEIEVGLIMEI